MSERDQTSEFYRQISEMGPDDIVPGCGFYREDSKPEAETELFIDYLVAAIRGPEWMLRHYTDPDYRNSVEQGLPVAQFANAHEVATLKEVLLLSDSELRDVVRRFNEPDYRYSNKISDQGDLPIRALEIMTDQYPNLTFFRGTDFSVETIYTGTDFLIGDLPSAVSWSRQGFNLVPRKHPVIVAILVRDFVYEFTHGNASIRNGLPWKNDSWRLIMTAGNRNETRNRIARVWRVPADHAKVDLLKKTFNQRAIRLS